MRVLLFGLPISAHRRLKEESGDWQEAVPEPHTFSSIPTDTNEHTHYSDGELRELRASIGKGFTHIIIPASRDWNEIQRRIQFDCRVHIARLWQPLSDVHWADLKTHLHGIVSLDEKWLEKLRPTDLRHALLLPPTVFRTNKKTDKYWHTCDAYSEDRITRATRLLDTVEREHRKTDGKGVRSWIDDNNRRYRVDPSKHARTTEDRAEEKSYRFCFEIPPGFHYDVADDAGRSFFVQIDGRSQSVTHCNVSPWGYIRRG
jgi:hypothetical protein